MWYWGKWEVGGTGCGDGGEQTLHPLFFFCARCYHPCGTTRATPLGATASLMIAFISCSAFKKRKKIDLVSLSKVASSTMKPYGGALV